MRYCVTGATGFIGQRVVRQLLDAGHDVVALARNPGSAAGLAALGVEVVAGDITRPDTLPGAMARADGVFHLAGWYRLGARDRSMAEATNVDGTRNVLRAARELGIPKVVYTSTLAVYGHNDAPVDESHRSPSVWLSEYDRTKWLAHFRVAVPEIDAGLPLVIVLPGLVHGPGDHSNVGLALRDYLRGRLPVIPKQGGCWALVDDVAAGHVLAMEKGAPGNSYNLSGPCLLWEEVLSVAEGITGIRPPRFVLPPTVARLSSWLMRPVNALGVPLPATYHPETLRVAAGTTYFARDDKARRELGWEPRPLREGLEITLRAELDALQRRSTP